jgi:archaeal type IV pilus assembly protein PilA
VLFGLILIFAMMSGSSSGSSAAFFGVIYILWFLFTIIFTVMYYAYQESSDKQATIGKQLMGLMVTDYEGRTISFGTAVGRYLAKILSALIICIGFFMIGFTEKNQGLHDYIVKTYVVKKAEPNTIVVFLVIGIFLFIVVTIVLAAVIAAFVFGMAGNISKTMVVAATVQQPDSSHIVITYQGGQDADKLRDIAITVTDHSGNIQTRTIGPAYQSTSVQVGSTSEFSGSFSGKDHVVATGTFSEGTQQVILDTYI